MNVFQSSNEFKTTGLYNASLVKLLYIYVPNGISRDNIYPMVVSLTNLKTANLR